MRRKPAIIEQSTYTPNHLLDTLMHKLAVDSDAALARALKVPPSTISKVRHKQVGINSALLLAAHEATEISIRELRELMGDCNTGFWQGSLGITATTKAPAKRPSYLEQRRGILHGNAQYA